MTHDKSGCPALSSLHQVAIAIRSESALARRPLGVHTRAVANVTDNNAATVVAFTESRARDLLKNNNTIIKKKVGMNCPFKLAAVPSLFIYAVVKAPIKTEITGERRRPAFFS